MKDSPRRFRTLVLIAAWLLIGTGCRDKEAEAEARARQSRQMRDVSHMLDALESPSDALSPAGSGAIDTPSSGEAVDLSSPYRRDIARQWRDPRWLLLLLLPAAFAGARLLRRVRARRAPKPLSIADLFAKAEPMPASVPRPKLSEPAPTAPAPATAPSTAPPEKTMPPAAVPDATTDASDEPFGQHPSLHLIGDPRFPELHRVGDAELPFDAWRDQLSRTMQGDDAPAASARWLLPALMVLHSRALRRRDAEAMLDDATALADAALLRATPDDAPFWIARRIRIELARIERQSGATRLFALRALQGRQADEFDLDAACVLDAWIDVQLAWASWLLGDGANARQDEAESLGMRLTALAPALGRRRLADVALQRADGARTTAQLDHLEKAQSLLEEAHALDGDPHTALLIARTAHRRAITLPPRDAADVCSVALMHAFLAEQHPAWRVEALECRLAVQMAYESLPGRTAQGEVVATLGRELAAMDAESAGARITMAAARLHEGDFAGASALCEAAWQGGADDTRLLTVWRDACRGWSDTAGHDRQALAHALRQLALARATL